jgi:hypothetical protein
VNGRSAIREEDEILGCSLVDRLTLAPLIYRVSMQAPRGCATRDPALAPSWSTRMRPAWPAIGLCLTDGGCYLKPRPHSWSRHRLGYPAD